VINGAIVAVGETIGEIELVGIAGGSVTVRGPDGEERVLRVPR
jgi:hypothetical protein